jgi:hypothetical protein
MDKIILPYSIPGLNEKVAFTGKQRQLPSTLLKRLNECKRIKKDLAHHWGSADMERLGFLHRCLIRTI